jgi:hypothetical protein
MPPTTDDNRLDARLRGTRSHIPETDTNTPPSHSLLHRATRRLSNEPVGFIRHLVSPLVESRSHVSSYTRIYTPLNLRPTSIRSNREVPRARGPGPGSNTRKTTFLVTRAVAVLTSRSDRLGRKPLALRLILVSQSLVSQICTLPDIAYTELALFLLSTHHRQFFISALIAFVSVRGMGIEYVWMAIGATITITARCPGQRARTPGRATKSPTDVVRIRQCMLLGLAALSARSMKREVSPYQIPFSFQVW